MNSKDVESDATALESGEDGRGSVDHESTASDRETDWSGGPNRPHRARREPAYELRPSRLAGGLAGVGIVAIIAGVYVPDARDVLFGLGGAGLFGGLLAYYLAPARSISASVGERVYEAGAANGDAIVNALGYSRERVYVPVDDSNVRLFVPDDSDGAVPVDCSIPGFTTADVDGLVLEPTGSRLFSEFERVLTIEFPSEPEPIAASLADGLLESLELADEVDPDVGPADEEATVTVSGSALGAVDRFDHPIASFLAVGFATGLERPVWLEVESGPNRAEWVVTCRWLTSD